MAKYSIEDTTLSAIAEAIREKGGTTEAMTPADMVEAIAAIQAGGGGGRPFATGTFQQNSTVTSYTVSGLPFQPSVVFAILDIYVQNTRPVAAVMFQDAENNIGRYVILQYDSYIYGSYGSLSTGTVASMNSDGFMLRVPQGYYILNKYYWVAIGAEG